MPELFEITLRHPPQMTEIVIGALLDAEIHSFEEGEGWIRWFAETKPELSALKSDLARRLEGETFELTFCEVKNPTDWQERWKENWTAVEISPRLAICPAWIDYAAKAGQQVVILETTSAFGTGAHETTRMCLELLEDVSPAGSVLDVGCGSGVLSIAAEKLGAKKVLGIDIDPLAVETAQQNATRNACCNCEFSATPLSEISGAFDVVVANILSSTLKILWPELQRLLTPGGKLILSGILAEEVEGFQRELALQGTVHQRGEWIALLGART